MPGDSFLCARLPLPIGLSISFGRRPEGAFLYFAFDEVPRDVNPARMLAAGL
jgi:hypothetical protein